MDATSIRPWTICCPLVHDMEGHTIRKIILLLTVVAIGLAGSSIVTVNIHRGEDVREENTFTRPPVQNERPAPVENSVEDVQPSPSVESGQTLPTVEDAPTPAYTEEELEILAIIIYQEAGGDRCSDDTRRKVGSVFLNRVASPYFPDAFEEVATGERQYGTLYLTGIKWPDRATNPQEAHAVERAYRIAEELLLSGSILPPNVIWQAEFPQGEGTYCHQDGIYFCYSEVSK